VIVQYMECVKMKNKLFLSLLLGIFLISFCSAGLGTSKQNDCVSIVVQSNCSSVILNQVTSTSSGNMFFINTSMQHLSGQDFNYTFCNTSYLGEYDYSWNEDCVDCSGGLCGNKFEITPSGNTLSTGESIIYLISTFMIFLLLMILGYLSIVIPYGDEKDNKGNVIQIVKLKYIKLMIIAIIWPLLALFLNLLNGLAINYAYLSIYSGTIGLLFSVMLKTTFIWFIIIALWIFILLIKDTNHRKIIKEYNLNNYY
jgi:hypothetical protein